MDYTDFFPKWGPYGKKYMGFSRIFESENSRVDGLRFDITAVPSVFGDIKIPNTTVTSGCHPFLCSSDYSFLKYRFDILNKDEVYGEVSYVKIDDDDYLIRTEIFNNSEFLENCLVNYFASIEYPSPSYCELTLPKKSEFKKALDYDTYEYRKKRPWDEQNADGLKKGEFLDRDFVLGKGLGDRATKWHLPNRIFKPFGGEAGDKVEFTINSKNSYQDAYLVARYRTCDITYDTEEKKICPDIELTESKYDAEFTFNGESIAFRRSKDLTFKFIKLGKLNRGEFKFSFLSKGKAGIEFDFFAIIEKDDVSYVKTETRNFSFTPDINFNGDGSVSYQYKDVKGEIKLKVFNKNTRYRSIHTGCLEDCITSKLSNPDPSFDDVTDSFSGSFSRKRSDEGFFHNAVSHTIFINPGESKTEYAVISLGDASYKSVLEYEEIYQKKLKEADNLEFNESGEKYKFSVNILKSTLLYNVVYPIYKYGEYIPHHTPGKRWDCLYTWDSGFIGLAMEKIAPKYALYGLKTYITDGENPNYVFLHHGSIVPTQFYLYLEELNDSRDKTELLKLYPSLKLYYEFLLGRVRGSTMGKFKSGLLTTYDYFYSSSGMDDYPAQVAMIKRDLREHTSPAISSSQAARCAKILKMISDRLSLVSDTKIYKNDIDNLKNSLDRYSWDSESGYYGFVVHDENLNPLGILRTENDDNYNKGLDGIYPLIAGLCSKEQKEAVISHIKGEKEMFSPYGISAVDMSAEYFSVNGYWNGNVWFPHQWFIWKTMLDLGDADFAFKIAERALNSWKREVDHSYYTFEMLSVVTGRGGWFHNFGGLSSPILLWAFAYFKPGEFNSGFDLWIEDKRFSNDFKSFQSRIKYYGDNDKFTVIICLNGNKNIKYHVYLDGKETRFVERFKGTLEVELNVNAKNFHKLTVSYE